jgi:hypothetical protein
MTASIMKKGGDLNFEFNWNCELVPGYGNKRGTVTDYSLDIKKVQPSWSLVNQTSQNESKNVERKKSTEKEIVEQNIAKEEAAQNIGTLSSEDLTKKDLGKDEEEIMETQLKKSVLIKMELIKTELVKPEIIKSEMVEPELIKSETTNSEIIKPELIKSEIIKPEMIKSERIKSETIKSEMIKSEIIKSEKINSQFIECKEQVGQLETDNLFQFDAVLDSSSVTDYNSLDYPNNNHYRNPNKNSKVSDVSHEIHKHCKYNERNADIYEEVEENKEKLSLSQIFEELALEFQEQMFERELEHQFQMNTVQEKLLENENEIESLQIDLSKKIEETAAMKKEFQVKTKKLGDEVKKLTLERNNCDDRGTDIHEEFFESVEQLSLSQIFEELMLGFQEQMLEQEQEHQFQMNKVTEKFLESETDIESLKMDLSKKTEKFATMKQEFEIETKNLVDKLEKLKVEKKKQDISIKVVEENSLLKDQITDQTEKLTSELEVDGT